MPRRRSKRQAKFTGAAIALTLQAIAAVISAIALAVVAYYKWASQIADSKRKMAAYLAPVGLVAMLSIIGLAAPSQQATEPTPQTAAYEYNRDLEGDVAQAVPLEEVEPEIVVEPDPVVEPEPYVEPEPIADEIGYISS